MLNTVEPIPVKLFAGVLYRDGAAWDAAVDAMRRAWGDADSTGVPVPFDLTEYYAAEMGPGLVRRFIGFARLVAAERLATLKLEANAIEAALCRDGRRTVNIDVGYLDFHKIVLASTKEGAHRLYLGQGIWAELTLSYEHGAWHAFPWTFPDFRSGRYDEWFLAQREQYRRTVRAAAVRDGG